MTWFNIPFEENMEIQHPSERILCIYFKNINRSSNVRQHYLSCWSSGLKRFLRKYTAFQGWESCQVPIPACTAVTCPLLASRHFTRSSNETCAMPTEYTWFMRKLPQTHYSAMSTHEGYKEPQNGLEGTLKDHPVLPPAVGRDALH